MTKNLQFVLRDLPKNKLEPDHFELVEQDMPVPGNGEALVKVRYISLDAANRAWMQGRTYRDPLGAGSVMAGGGLCEVVDANGTALQAGDLVRAECGWQQYASLSAGALEKVEPMEPLSYLLSVYGITGLTAYFGLLQIGDPQPGETVVVSAAAGAVGSIVGQIAKIRGARVVGITGSDAKCRWLVEDLGFDAAVNHHKEDLAGELSKACPDGIDVYFDNTGGNILQAVLFQMNMNGRIPCCGAVSQYDQAGAGAGIIGVPGLLVVKRVLMRGFIVMDFFDQRPQALRQLSDWVAQGRLTVKEDIIDGFENLPTALIGLLAGENIGKRMVRVA